MRAGGGEGAVLVDELDDRLRDDGQADRRGQREIKAEAQRLLDRFAEGLQIVERVLARDGGQRDRRDGDAENADGQLHQPEGVVEPRDRAVRMCEANWPLTSDVDLHGRAGDGARDHQDQHGAQRRVAEIELATVKRKPSLQSDGSWMRELRQAAEQHAEAPAENRRARRSGDGASPAAARRSKAKSAPLTTETMLKTVLALAGMPKIFRALSMPITAAASETKRMKGKSSRVMLHGQLEFSGHVFEAAAR